MITTMMMQLLVELEMVDGDNVFEGESASEGVNEEDWMLQERGKGGSFI